MKQLSNEYVGDSLSRGTMRTEDLIPYFMEFLQGVKEKCGIEKTVGYIQDAIDKLEMVEHTGYGEYYKDQEQSSYLLNEDIWDLLNEIAPEFTYFGSSEGDGADFGFWTYEDGLKEHLQFEFENLDTDDLVKTRQELEILVDLLSIHGY